MDILNFVSWLGTSPPTLSTQVGIDVIDVMNQEHMNRQGKKEHSASVHPVSNHTSKRALYELLMLWTIAYCATMDSQAQYEPCTAS